MTCRRSPFTSSSRGDWPSVILTMRSGESPPDAITAIWKDHHLERLELQPLSLSEITGLVEHVLDGPVDSFSAQRLWQYTQGNALYLRHLLDNEVTAGRMTQRSGLWLWDGATGTLTDTGRVARSANLAGAEVRPRCARRPRVGRADGNPMCWRRSPIPTRVAEAESLGLISCRPPRATRVGSARSPATGRGAPQRVPADAAVARAHRHRARQRRLDRSARPWCDERSSPWNPTSHPIRTSYSPRRRPRCSSVIYDSPKCWPSAQ